jgi:hypothetical protein
MTLLAHHWHPSCLSCTSCPPSTFLLPRHPSRLTELSIHYSICYLIYVSVWFVVYLTLSFLSDVVDRGGNMKAFGSLSPLIRRV